MAFKCLIVAFLMVQTGFACHLGKEGLLREKEEGGCGCGHIPEPPCGGYPLLPPPPMPCAHQQRVEYIPQPVQYVQQPIQYIPHTPIRQVAYAQSPYQYLQRPQYSPRVQQVEKEAQDKLPLTLTIALPLEKLNKPCQRTQVIHQQPQVIQQQPHVIYQQQPQIVQQPQYIQHQPVYVQQAPCPCSGK